MTVPVPTPGAVQVAAKVYPPAAKAGVECSKYCLPLSGLILVPAMGLDNVPAWALEDVSATPCTPCTKPN